MECGMLEEKSAKRLNWIDSLKGIAICAVVWVHSGDGGIKNWFDPLGRSGAYWVEMFFILTVYLAFRSLKGKSVFSVFGWYLQRLWKLTPLYYFMLLLYIIVVPEGANIWLGTSVGRPDNKNIVMHLLYLHSLFPYYANSIMWVEWYLGVMVIYMLALPILRKYIRQRKEAVSLTVVFVAISFFGTLLLSSINPLKDDYIWNGWIYTYSFIIHMPALAVGVLLYYLDNLQLKKKQANIICGISIVNYILFSYVSAYGETIRLIQIAKISGFTLVFLCFILSVRVSDNSIFNNRIWQSLGRNSYAIYLLHFLLIYICGYFLSDELAAGILGSRLLWQAIKFLCVMVICLCFAILYDKTAGERIYAWGKRKLSEYFG